MISAPVMAVAVDYIIRVVGRRHAFISQSTGPDYVCKDPTDYMEYIWINYVIHSQTTPEEQALLHRTDMWSSWFSVPNQQEKAKLHVYPRLQYLINDAQALRDDRKASEQFPSLVSFFGETG